ncbi:MAG: cysteine synthase A [Planctomycetes bacterium]|nr:cysteine synthase A [Planctomycetota bacterium]
MMIFADNTATVGKTPLVELRRLAKGLPGRVLAKLEMRNPCGSVKDRVGVAMIEDAERRGALRPGMTIVEATGGNTGIGLAFAAAIRRYHLILTMPETMSRERVALLRHLGAEVILTPGILMRDAVAKAVQLVKELTSAINLDQFSNPVNPEVHRLTTAVEIWEDTRGAVDLFVSAVGTGGTITGVGEIMKERKPSVRIIAVEPTGAAVLSGKPAGNHRMPGIGVGFVPTVLNRAILDEIVAVTDDEAFACARRLGREEGILAGVSSGAALHAALTVAARSDAVGKTVVTLLADTGERYITTELFTLLSCEPNRTCARCRVLVRLGSPDLTTEDILLKEVAMDRKIIENYAACGSQLRRAVAGLSKDDLTARPGPGKWSILEVIVHLTDSDSISIDRMKRILTEDNPSLLYADETAYVDRLFTHDQSLDDALTLFEVNRRQFARVLRKLPDDAFERQGTHNRRGAVTVGEMVKDYVEHVEYHLKFVQEKRAQLGKPAAQTAK